MIERQIIRNAIITPDGTYLHSHHRHDFVSHEDSLTKEIYFTDGGNNYIRRSVNECQAVSLDVYLDDDYELVRCAFVWKSYGKNYEHPDGIYIALCDLTNSHISNILLTQWHIEYTYVKDLLNKELNYRKKHNILKE